MNTSQTSSHGYGGGGACGCASKLADSALAGAPNDTGSGLSHSPEPQPIAMVNGIALHAPEQRPDEETLRECAYGELLRQQAVRSGLLPLQRVLTAPELIDADRAVIAAMVDAAVQVPEPTPEECLRYFEARKAQYLVGQAVHMRHILFAVTPGVDAQALAVHAQKVLIRLLDKNAPPDSFAKLAAEWSNCPTSTQGGDLGWVEPRDCAPELAHTLFFQTETPVGLGLQPRLIHTRFGLHIIDVLERREGRQLAYDDVRERVAEHLAMQSRAKALHQYMRLLAGQALVEGVELDAATSALVQ
jgi:peptidyl-prolyl cis-trans isomerase C